MTHWGLFGALCSPALGQHFANGGSSINTAPTCLSCIHVDLTIRNALSTILHCIYLCSLDSMYFDVFDCFHDLSIQHDTTTIDVLAEVGSETNRRRETARAPAIVPWRSWRLPMEVTPTLKFSMSRPSTPFLNDIQKKCNHKSKTF